MSSVKVLVAPSLNVRLVVTLVGDVNVALGLKTSGSPTTRVEPKVAAVEMFSDPPVNGVAASRVMVVKSDEMAPMVKVPLLLGGPTVEPDIVIESPALRPIKAPGKRAD